MGSQELLTKEEIPQPQHTVGARAPAGLVLTALAPANANTSSYLALLLDPAARSQGDPSPLLLFPGGREDVCCSSFARPSGLLGKLKHACKDIGL